MIYINGIDIEDKNMKKEEKESIERFFEEAFTGYERSVINEYAKQEAIEFFKWYAIKMVTLLAYIKDIRPLVASNEMEEKIEEVEGKSFDVLYSLYLKSKENV